jgi:hypothetical protein
VKALGRVTCGFRVCALFIFFVLVAYRQFVTKVSDRVWYVLLAIDEVWIFNIREPRRTQRPCSHPIRK